MKNALNRIGLFAIEAQKYLRVAMMVYAVFAVLILRNPDNDGGGGH